MSVMTKTPSPGTGEIPWTPDASLIDAAREIAPIIQEHSHEAERERRLSQPVLKALRETGLLRMNTPRSLGGLETDPVTRALVVEEIGRHDSAAAWNLGEPSGLGLLLRPSSRRGSRRDLQPRSGHPDRRPVRPPT